MTAREQSSGTAVVAAYEATREENSALRDVRNRRPKKQIAPRLKVTHDGNLASIQPDHPDLLTGSLLLAASVGTTSLEFLNGLVAQISTVTSKGQRPDERGINFMLSMIRAVEPKDEIEAMLAAQMAAVHMATMTFARRLAQAENIAQQDSAQQGFNKLVRSFAAQVETLKRHRTGGEQKVTVQHVTVNEGGQAVVGNITNRRGGGRRKKGKPTS